MDFGKADGLISAQVTQRMADLPNYIKALQAK